MRYRVLFVSPHLDDAGCLARMLLPLSIAIDSVETLEQAHARLRQSRYDAILTEASLADGNWLDMLHLARTVAESAPVIVTDRLAEPRFWAEILNLGAFDLLAQPFDENEVQRIMRNACSHVARASGPARRGSAAAARV